MVRLVPAVVILGDVGVARFEITLQSVQAIESDIWKDLKKTKDKQKAVPTSKASSVLSIDQTLFYLLFCPLRRFPSDHNSKLKTALQSKISEGDGIQADSQSTYFLQIEK